MKYGSFPSENKDLEKVVANDDGNQEDDANLIESVAEWAFVQARNSLKQKRGIKLMSVESRVGFRMVKSILTAHIHRIPSKVT